MVEKSSYLQVINGFIVILLISLMGFAKDYPVIKLFGVCVSFILLVLFVIIDHRGRDNNTPQNRIEYSLNISLILSILYGYTMYKLFIFLILSFGSITLLKLLTYIFVKNDNLLENEIISHLNDVTGLHYTLYHYRDIGYLYIIISFILISVVMSSNSVLLLCVGVIFSYLLYTEGRKFAKVDLEYMYMLHLPEEKKKSALLLEIIKQFFHNGSVYVEFGEPQENKKGYILKAVFTSPNNPNIIVNFSKNYNVLKGKKYKIADLIK
jgi:hypothetical protein